MKRIYYIDEKGPQDTIRKPKVIDRFSRISLGTDGMRVYVADIVSLPLEQLSNFEEEYKEIESEYKGRLQSNIDKELKCKDILKGKFDYGVASLDNRRINFFYSLFELLEKYKAENLTFSINKLSLVVSKRFDNWILKLDSKRIIESPLNFKYTMVKYLENEASNEIINKIFDSNILNKSLLYMIQDDLKKLQTKYKDVSRTKIQSEEYKNIVSIIRNNKHLVDDCFFEEIDFDWNKVGFDVDLWISEEKCLSNVTLDKGTLKRILYLDKGIPEEPFTSYGHFDVIYKDQDSHNHVGLRIADSLAVIAGNYISKMSYDCRRERTDVTQRILLSSSWFNFNESQFNLIKLISHFYIANKDSQYLYQVDTYFDEGTIFLAFCSYINDFNDFEDYRKLSLNEHVNGHFLQLHKLFVTKYSLAVKNTKMARMIYGDYKTGIDEKQIRPL